MNSYEIERMGRDIKREITTQIAADARQMEAQIAQMSEFWDAYPGLVQQTLAIGSQTPASRPPATPAPEPTLAQQLEEMPPDEFFKAMQADPQGILAKIAQADQEG